MADAKVKAGEPRLSVQGNEGPRTLRISGPRGRTANGGQAETLEIAAKSGVCTTCPASAPFRQAEILGHPGRQVFVEVRIPPTRSRGDLPSWSYDRPSGASRRVAERWDLPAVTA